MEDLPVKSLCALVRLMFVVLIAFLLTAPPAHANTLDHPRIDSSVVPHDGTATVFAADSVFAVKYELQADAIRMLVRSVSVRSCRVEPPNRYAVSRGGDSSTTVRSVRSVRLIRMRGSAVARSTA